MSTHTTVRVLVLNGGERLPVLLDLTTQQPLFEPLIYVVSRLRGRAANTIYQHLVGLQVLLGFCSDRGIDLAERMRTGRLLSLFEVDGLVAAASRYRGRRQSPSTARRLSRQTAASRLRMVRAYLAWLAKRQLHQLASSGASCESYRGQLDRLLADLAARTPSVRLASGQRSCLSPKQRYSLLSAIEPGCVANPWSGVRCQSRNFVILRLLYELGVRRGELLALRLEDIDVRQGRLSIRRRPDDPRDPRRRQPVAKTEERVLELGIELSRDLAEYILKTRRSLHAARTHGYLFVDTHRGAPLTASGLDKVFVRLRTVEGIPKDFTSHVLRHDWNDRFSTLMENKRVKPGDEQRLRMYLQGWSWVGSAQRYNQRHIVKRANEALLRMQERAVEEQPANER